ncbi:PREDICTED: slowpoke-binding protein-like isoform X2 [Amphimedon queenslandica]|uniref:WH2 domain-containing protein n=1 Tax=Amphimedon queenslandica TaxID=400682 RepID=A0A1X7VTY3_AMPQE|nr:PREDICTED: slowpoke-binding protein-like isoform X2 [Amphimedon queenslandica]|eukprot:XP_011403693.1 PREDICTED: slowpoke-binding protein-like isoform X2 [Amphimedon queenslandica]
MVFECSSNSTCWENCNLVCIGLTAGGSLIVLVLCIVIITAIVCCCCCLYRRRSRRLRYTPLRDPSGSVVTTYNPATRRNQDIRSGSISDAVAEEGLYEAMQRQRKERESTRRETGLLNCQFYLRSNQKYVLETHLPDIGSRISKSWFMVRPISGGQFNPPFLLTMSPISQQCRLNLQGTDKHVMNRLFRILEHQCIHKIMEIDYIPDKRIIVILEPFLQRGSLKDLIYHTTPSLPWSTKYSVRRSGLRTHQIQNFGRQILEAVLFVHELGFKPFGQIQSGNIYLEGGRCRVSGIDNAILGYKPRVSRNVKTYKENIDSVMFGHLLFELGSGKELSNPAPIESDYKNVKNQQVVEVLQFIFQSRIPPTIDEILQLPFFQNARTSVDNPEGIRLDEDIIELIQKSRRYRSKGGKGRKASSSTYSNEGYYRSSLFSTTPQVADSTVTSSAANESSLPPPPPPPPPSNTNDKSALWSDIHKGKTLRPTVTDDRSAPMI